MMDADFEGTSRSEHVGGPHEQDWSQASRSQEEEREPRQAPQRLTIDTLLLQGRELIDQTSRAHSELWGLGKAERWALDQAAGRIVWSFDDHVASAPAQILGSWNGKVSTFVWSWDNDSVLPAMCVVAEEVRAWGVANDVGALSSSPAFGAVTVEETDGRTSTFDVGNQ